VTYLARVRLELAALEQRSLLRVPRRCVPDRAIDFSSNDYLGLSRDARVLAALRQSERVGSGGSRLLGGAHREHAALEDDLALWTGRERALLFSSGYLAALGAIATLARFVDVAYSDALVHACLIDALRLAKVPRYIFPHATIPLRAAGDGGAIVVTESLFGMDGSIAPLAALVRGLRATDVLVVDEAHALGVAGSRGSGLAAADHDERVVVIGTLSKALGAAGGFIAGPADVMALLATAARTFVFDTAPPPAIAAAARAALAIARGDEGDALRRRLARNARHVRAGLRDCGFDVPGDGDAIVPLVIGNERDALALAHELELRGVFAPAIRPPTVPRGTARLRITVRADHTEADIETLHEAMAAVRLAPR